MLGSGLNLITTVTGFAMSATFIVFVCTRLICGRLRRLDSRQIFQTDSRIDLEMPEHQITGPEPVLVAAIPTMKFHHEAFSSTDDAQCSICLEEYQEKEVLRIMPKCGHSFHLFCIDVWLRKQSTCPVCRLSLLNPFEARHVRQVTYGMAQPTNNPEISIEHSQRWLPPVRAAGQSRDSGNNQMNAESSTLNLQPINSEETGGRS